MSKPTGLTGLLLTIIMLSACSDKPFNYAQDLNQQFIAMEAAFNDGDTRLVLDAIAPEFSSTGFSDRSQLRLFMLRQRQKVSRISSHSGPLNIKLNFPTDHQQSITASAQFKTLMTGGNGLFPDRGRLLQFQTVWQFIDAADEGEHWQLSSAHWDDVFTP